MVRIRLREDFRWVGPPYRKASCWEVGVSVGGGDGWTDISTPRTMQMCVAD